MKVGIKLNLGPELQEFMDATWSPQDDVNVIQLAENELAADNFAYIWKSHQGRWEPLSPAYAKWKHKYYPGRKMWELTGASMKSLTTPAKIEHGHSYVEHKHVYLSRPQPGVVTAEYRFDAPAAGGYFKKNNQRRKIWWLTDLSRQRIEGTIYRYLSAKIQRAFNTK